MSSQTTIAIVGIGLIGGSLALALKKYSSLYHILGVDHSSRALQTALERQAIDSTATLEEASHQADILIIATPISQTDAVLRTCLPKLKRNALISDVGSTKLNVSTSARSILGSKIAQFIPAHPIAGREYHGIDAAQPDLFVNKKTIICPLPENRPEDLQKLQALWEAAGARCHLLSSEQHDAIFAATSHLPHLLAYAYMAHIANTDDMHIKLDLAGSGFRDFTRIAASCPEIWADIFSSNRSALLREFDTLQLLFAKIKSMIEHNQTDTLINVLREAAQTRRTWQENHS